MFLDKENVKRNHLFLVFVAKHFLVVYNFTRQRENLCFIEIRNFAVVFSAFFTFLVLFICARERVTTALHRNDYNQTQEKKVFFCFFYLIATGIVITRTIKEKTLLIKMQKNEIKSAVVFFNANYYGTAVIVL